MSEEFEKYRCDRDRRTYEHIVETYYPMVASVCRRMLRDPNDVEDTVQETFLRLTRHIDSISGSVPAWLAATARAASTDLIRRSIRQRNRQQALALTEDARQRVRDVPQMATQEAIRLRLYDALLALPAENRDLLLARCVRKTPLRVVAAQLDVSVATAHRRFAEAIEQLAAVLRDMGVAAADDRAIAEHFGDVALLAGPQQTPDHGGLRFAPDWRSAELLPLGEAPAPTHFQGLARTLRVGILISYQSTRVLGVNRMYVGTKWQVHTAAFLPATGLQLVGVIEPGTVDRGVIESTLRDYGILGGLIEADDEPALATLDVLLLGFNYAMPPSVARAINRAVRGGMGLLNEYWTGSHLGSEDHQSVRELMLADSPLYKYHMPGECGGLLPAAVLDEHPLLPGISAGTRVLIRGCGPAYKVAPGARVLVAKDLTIPLREHGMSDVGALQMPCYILGSLGRGRVAVVHAWPHEWFVRLLGIGCGDYFANLLRWLAGGRDDVQ